MYWRLISRNLRRRPWQTGLTVFVVCFCTAALVTCFLTVWGLERGAKGTADNLGADILALPSSAEFEAGQVLFTGSPANIYMKKEIVEEIALIPGVKAATAQFFSQTLNQSCCSLPEEYRLVGYDPENDFLVNRLLSIGLGRELKEKEVVVGGGVPAFLGDRVLILGEAFQVVDYLKPLGGSVDKTIFVPIETARSLASGSPFLVEIWEEQGDPLELVSAVLIQVESNYDPAILARQIGRIPGVKAMASAKIFLDLKEQLKVFQVLTWLLAALIIGLTLASLLSRYSSLVMERQEELGLLRALGMGQKGLFNLIMAETFTTAFVAGGIGVFLGFGFIWFLKNFIEKHSSFPFLLPLGLQLLGILFFAVLLVIFISTLAALGPARTSAKLDPVVVLTEGELK
ncbi:MAG: FtsX-like permease family protein [Bacillota bacterium]